MSIEALLKYPLVFLAGLVTALGVVPLWRWIAPRWGFMDRPGERKIHRNPIPVGGGIAVFLGFHVACAVVFLLPWKPFSGQVSIEWWFRFIPLSIGVVGLGLLDDRLDLRPWLKLAGQVLLAVAAYALGIRLQNILGMALPGWVDAVATVLWFVALMNAFNLIDGVDGLATGIALIAAMGIGLSLIFRGAPGDVLLFMGFAGACLGFLRYNFYPASVFLGDTGSLFLGFTLAALSISTHSKASFMAGMGVPLLAVGVPLFDTLLAIWRRSMRHVLNREINGQNRLALEQADRDHLHHRLLRKGLGQDRVAWTLYMATAVLVLVGILASVFHDRALGILVLAFLLAAYTVVRHLMGIELRESGNVVLQGLSRPVRRNQTLLFYLTGDVLILNVVLLLFLKLWILTGFSGVLPLKTSWLQQAPVDVVLPFICLVLFRSYSRVWYLARVSEYAATGLAVVLGYGLACGLHLLTSHSIQQSVFWIYYYLLMAGIAAPLIMLTRAAVRIVQDLMQWRPRSGDPSSVSRSLIYGAGFRTVLFLRQLSFTSAERVPAQIVGLVSDDSAIKGHYVHGIRVIGSGADLPILIPQHRIQKLYLIEPISESDLKTLRHSLRKLDVQLIRWELLETEISVSSHV
jgi:UDP-GlcNAc:undecaprenyl-phosphate/decaprenyl-phosphate GlcNAc-1-phosphate transferase